MLQVNQQRHYGTDTTAYTQTDSPGVAPERGRSLISPIAWLSHKMQTTSRGRGSDMNATSARTSRILNAEGAGAWCGRRRPAGRPGSQRHKPHRLTELRFHVPLDAESAVSETFFPANLLASIPNHKPHHHQSRRLTVNRLSPW